MHIYQVPEKKTVTLRSIDPDDTRLWEKGKESAKKKLKEIRKELIHLQKLLYAEHKHKILIVLQALDSGGKDGTIRSIFKGVNPQGVKVFSFKVPATEELAHDYLWRVHKRTPGDGEIVIFNRSHYEDVLIVRVHELVAKETWKKRYDHIRNFEKILTDEGTTIIKFFLHITKNEQKERFLERIKVKEKQWKFNPGDIEERKLWNQYMAAYEDALNKTSTTSAPWFIIPANRNWYRDLVISQIIVDQLISLKMKYPSPVKNIDQYTKMI